MMHETIKNKNFKKSNMNNDTYVINESSENWISSEQYAKNVVSDMLSVYDMEQQNEILKAIKDELKEARSKEIERIKAEMEKVMKYTNSL